MLTSLSAAVLATSGVFLCLALVAVVLRFYIRRRTGFAFGKDDWLILLALFFTLGLCLINIIGVSVGHFGEPFSEIADGGYSVFLKFMFAWQFFYVLALAAIKLSCLCFYRRHFNTNFFQSCQTSLVWLSVVWALAFLITTTFQSWPIHCNWTLCPVPTTNYPAMYVCMSVTDVSLDLAILALPLFVLRKMRMDRRKRAAIALVLSLGTFCIVASIVRLAYAVRFLMLFQQQTEQTQQTPQAQQAYQLNFGDIAIGISMWSGIEAGASTVCACLPCFGAYILRIPLLERIIMANEAKGSWDGSADRFTGTLSMSSRYRRELSIGSKSPEMGDGMSTERGKLVMDEEMQRWNDSKDTLAMLDFLFEDGQPRGCPTLRDKFESEVEMGRVCLRTACSQHVVQSI